MSTRIISTNSYIYMKRFGFVNKLKLVLIGFMFLSTVLTISTYQYVNTQKVAFDNVILGIPIPPPPKVLTLEDHVANYIHKKNNKLSPTITAELATSVVKESEKRRIPIKLLLGVIEVESQFQQFAISETGAQGFMQIIARWHVDKIRNSVSKNLYAPAVNVAVGAETLRDCIDLHKSTEMALLCYSGSQHDATRDYSKKVLKAAQLVSLG